MFASFERIMALNVERKKALRGSKDIKKYRIEKEGNNYYIKRACKDSNYKKSLLHLGDVYDIYLDDYTYIENLSVLRNVPSIINNYYIDRVAWDCIRKHIDNLNCILNSFSIERVDNLLDILPKAILVGNVIYNQFFYILVLTKDKDLKMITDINLVVNNRTEFEFSWLRIKNIHIKNIITNNKQLGYLNICRGLFANCEYTENIVLDGFETKQVIAFDSMFCNCRNLKSITVKNINTYMASSLASMFENCEKLETLDLNSWNVLNVVNFGNMFKGCKSLKNLKIEKWLLNYMKRINCMSMFDGCSFIDVKYIKVRKQIKESLKAEIISLDNVHPTTITCL